MFAALLDKVSLGIPSAYRNLTLTPILLNLEEAIAEGPYSQAGSFVLRHRDQRRYDRPNKQSRQR
jgi:hypothetical protein